jgi:hypothetical protein
MSIRNKHSALHHIPEGLISKLFKCTSQALEIFNIKRDDNCAHVIAHTKLRSIAPLYCNLFVQHTHTHTYCLWLPLVASNSERASAYIGL